ncbi:MAG: methyltransferase [Micromonosporaceae bacterium]
MSDPIGTLFGFVMTQVAYVAVRLGVPDLLADSAMTSDALAGATGAHPPSLHRLLRAMATLGYVTETEPGRFALAPGGELLRDGVPGSLRQALLLFAGEETWRSWGELEYSIRTGRPAFDRLYGMPCFDYLARHPGKAEVFHRAMAKHTRDNAPAIVAGYDWSGLGTLVDVGGGDGTLLAAILAATPTLRGVLYDQPAALTAAPAVLDGAGVADRCEIVAGDFFTSVPVGGGAYLIKSVIHDWDDERAVRVLRTVADAGGTVLVVEPVLPPGVAGPEPLLLAISDLNMLAQVGGRERTEAEFGALFAAAGLTLRACHPAGHFQILEAG